MADPPVFTVPLAGTPQATMADFVNDHIEINAAIAAAVDARGGIVRLAAGDYSTSRAIVILGTASRSKTMPPAAPPFVRPRAGPRPTVRTVPA